MTDTDWRAKYDDACAVLHEPDSTNDGGTDLAEAIRVLSGNHTRAWLHIGRLEAALLAIQTAVDNYFSYSPSLRAVKARGPLQTARKLVFDVLRESV